MAVEERGSGGSSSRLRVAASIPALFFFLFASLLYPIENERVSISPELIHGLDALFFILFPLTCSFLAVRGHLAGGSMGLFLAGCALFASGGASLAAAWFMAGRAEMLPRLTPFNAGSLAAGVLHLAAARSILGESLRTATPRVPMKLRVVFSYGAMALGIAAFALWAPREYCAASPGLGGGLDLCRQFTSGLTVTLFIASSCIVMFSYSRTRSASHYWYALALLLMGQGLGCFVFQQAAWTPLSWMGRLFQYAGVGYLLVSVSVALRAVHTHGTPPVETVGGIGRAPELRIAGAPRGSAEFMADFAERRQAEDSLRESEERFRLATESLNGLVYEADLVTGSVRRWSGLFELLGYRTDQVPDRAEWWWLQIHPEDLEGLRRVRSEALAARRPVVSAEYRMRHRNGHWLWVMDNSRIMYDADGRAIRLVGCTISIDVRKKTQQLLRESEARHRRLFESDIIGIVHADRERITDANDVFLQLVGYTREDLEAGRLVWHGLTPSEYASRDEDALAELLERGNATPYEKEYFRRDGSRASILIGASLLSREPMKWVCFVLDITERKLMDEELRKSRDELELRVRERTAELLQANEALRRSEEEFRLLSSKLLTIQEEERKRIASELHDTIGQTLAALKYWVEMILHSRDHIDTEAAMNKLHLFVPTLQQSIEETRAIYMGLRPTILDNLGVVATIQWLRQQFDRLHPKHHIELDLDMKEEDIPEPLKIVIFRTVQEALNNVAKHSMAEWVDLSLTKKNGAIELSVVDDGVGVDMDAVLMKTGAKGCLGLTGMRERVELTGGAFSFESAPGEGTTVRASWRTVDE